MHDPLLSRRVFLADLGRGAVAVAVLGIVGCAPTQTPTPGPPSAGATPTGSPGPTGPPGTGVDTGSPGAASPSPSSASDGGPGAPGGYAWHRVNFGFVSAYLLVRDGEGAIVDTGVAGSEGAIVAAMTTLGLGWGDVAHVILTHKHPDHAGSISAILDAAPEATGYLGAADLAAVQAPRPLTSLADGDEVFGLEIVGSPGHTLGHMAVYDKVGGLLVAGDAIGTVGGPLAGSNPAYTEDETAARATVVKLGKLTFETLLVGHGEPILAGASGQVAALGGG